MLRLKTPGDLDKSDVLDVFDQSKNERLMGIELRSRRLALPSSAAFARRPP